MKYCVSNNLFPLQYCSNASSVCPQEDKEFGAYTSFRSSTLQQRRKQQSPLPRTPTDTLSTTIKENKTNHSLSFFPHQTPPSTPPSHVGSNPSIPLFYPGPPCSSPPDTYSMPHDAASLRGAPRHGTLTRDDTLPASFPLNATNTTTRLLHSFSYMNRDYQ